MSELGPLLVQSLLLYLELELSVLEILGGLIRDGGLTIVVNRRHALFSHENLLERMVTPRALIIVGAVGENGMEGLDHRDQSWQLLDG